MIVLTTAGCEITTASVTELTLCGELRAELFTMSASDTEQSKNGYADFLDVFEAVCG